MFNQDALAPLHPAQCAKSRRSTMVKDGSMILEILLGAIFVGGGGVLVWLGKVHVDDVRHARAEEAEFERLRLEEERLENERHREEQRVIAERRREQERQRLEQERLAEERRREQERQRLEQARLAEERRREKERQRLEEERLAEEQRRERERLEQERLAEEHRLEEERLAAQRRRDYERLAAERRHEEERLAEEQRRERERLEQEKLAVEHRREEEKRVSQRRYDYEKLVEEERLAAERRREEERLAEERRRERERLEQEKLAGKRRREEERLALEGRFEQVRLAARRRREEEQLTIQHHLEQECKAREQARAAAARICEEERLALERRKEEICRISGLIDKEFSDRGVASFNVQEFAVRQSLAIDDVIEAGLMLYTSMIKHAVSNKVFFSQQKVQFDWTARALEIDMAEVAEIENQAKTPVFRAAFEEATSNITLTAESLAELETVRQSISLRREDAAELMIRDGGRDVYFLMVEATIDIVQADSARRELLRSIRRLLFKDWETPFASPDQVDPLYRKAVALVLQDGIVEDQEREFLEWLRDEIHPSQREFDECASWIATVAKLADYRSGRLPTVPTTYLLEGGELCHFVGRCCYFEESRRGGIGLYGDLVVTDRKVRFISDEKSISMRPSQIMDVATNGTIIHLKTDTNRGRITFEVSDPGEIEAILIGVARRNKYAVNYASSTSRHIPQHIKAAVWSRDGGQCVKCGIDHALQFDHIIPFAEGGASTVENLQILCSPCNLQKGDRI